MAKKKRSARAGTPEARGEEVQAVVAEDLEPTEEVSDADALYGGVEGTGDDSVEVEEELPAKKMSVTARCEEAVEDSCSCRCRGKYHATKHPEGWKDEEGCEPLTPGERKVAKREALKAWRRAHPDRVKAYMENWRNTSDAVTAQIARAAAQKRMAESADPGTDLNP